MNKLQINTFTYTVKPAHVTTSIMQSPVLKGHFFSSPVIEHFISIESLLRGCPSYNLILYLFHED